MDALDVPLNNYLDAPFFEHPQRKDVQQVTAIIDESVLKYGIGQLRPRGNRLPRGIRRFQVYKWQSH